MKKLVLIILITVLSIGIFQVGSIYWLLNQKPLNFEQLSVQRQNQYQELKSFIKNAEPDKDYIQGMISVKFDEKKVNLDNKFSLDKLKKDLIVKKINLNQQGAFDETNWVVLSSQNLTTEQIIEEIYFYPYFEVIEPNYTISLSSVDELVPDDLNFQTQWNLNDLDLKKSYFLEKNASLSQDEVVVAILDSGLNIDHNDLKNNLWDGSVCRDHNGNLISGGCPNHGLFYNHNTLSYGHNINDINGHGTHLAGIIASQTNNSLALASFSWNNKLKIMPVKVMNDDGTGSIANLIYGIRFAKHNGAKIFNMSLASYHRAQMLKDEIEVNGDLLFVTSASNEGSNLDLDHNADCITWYQWSSVDAPNFDCENYGSIYRCCPNNAICCDRVAYPCEFNSDNLICVASLDSSDQLSFFSNYGSEHVDVGAPGDEILGADNDGVNDFVYHSGTSQAAPHVAGLAGLIWSFQPNLTSLEIKNIILRSGIDTPALDNKTVTGKKINVYQALKEAGVSISSSSSSSSQSSQSSSSLSSSSLSSSSSSVVSSSSSSNNSSNSSVSSSSSSNSSVSSNPNCQNPSAYLSSLSIDGFNLNFYQNEFTYEINANGQALNVDYETLDACAGTKELRTWFNGREYLLIVVLASDGKSSLVYSIAL